MSEELQRRVTQFVDHQTTIWGLHPDTLRAVAARIGNPMAPQAAELPVRAGSEDVPVTGGIAVLPLRGLITARRSFLSMLFGGGGGLQAFREGLRDAVASDDISAVIIDVDSPGGSSDLLTETAAEIRGARGKKPIVAISNTFAASAAYWLASQADELVVTPSGQVGSVGCYLLHWDESGLNEQLGLKPTFVSAGRYKVEGNPHEPLADEAEAAMQLIVDEYYDLFVEDVAKGRGVPVETVRNGFGEGRMVTAKRAVALGMADRVDTFEGTVARLADKQVEAKPALAVAPVPAAPSTETDPTSDVPEDPPADKPGSKEQSEEDRARIARVDTARPVHRPPKEEI